MSVMTIDQIGEQLLREARADGLKRLAGIALRTMREQTDQIWHQALGLLAGDSRLAASDRRIREIIDQHTPPAELAAIPAAPARGPMQLVPNMVRLAGGAREQQGAHWRRMDQLSIMCRHAYERHRASGSEVAFIAPFTPGQISMALHYQGLIERHDAAGMKCASVEARGGGGSGGSGGGFMEAYLDEGKEIEAIRRRIGAGVAMAVRRVRPSARGAGARPITDRELVERVCLWGEDLTAVLRACGWAVDGKNRKALRLALSGTLDRMQGNQKKGD